MTLQESGGKGYALKQLLDAGFNVPQFKILPLSFFNGIDRNSENVREQIVDECKKHLQIWKAQFSGKLLAVRSSALAEDSLAHSFAGQFKTLLKVSCEDLPDAIADVWLSGKNGQTYSSIHGLQSDTRMAVILQQLVEAKAAGVAFSANPINGTEEIVINAVHGFGDKLVDGSVNSDSYSVLGETIISKQIASDNSVLNDEQILEITAVAKRAHSFFGGPQDVEFAFDNESLYVLQSRPITTLPRTATVWDNSNIVESYPGLTQPLTFSFIEKMYDAVYRQFCALLGVKNAKIERHANAFANMLGLLNGRVYYNLNSWYQALALLPGYNLNAEAMEKMMGVKEKPDIKVETEESSKVKLWWDLLGAVTGILRNLYSARRQARKFESGFNEVYSGFADVDFESKPIEKIWADYQQFETLMVRQWKAPLVNDFFAMIYFGLLQKQCAAIVPEDLNLHNRLLAGSDAVLTTQPMKELPKIIKAIKANEQLSTTATNGSVEEFSLELHRPEHLPVLKMIQDYIRVWGERSVAELKLETVTYQQNPMLLLNLLQSYLKGNGKFYLKANHSNNDRQLTEQNVREHLKGKGIKRALFNHILRQARYFVTQRENLRYYRTRGFGMVRRMMLGIGKQLETKGCINNGRDVFWLQLDEVEKLVAEQKSMQAIVTERKKNYEAFENAAISQRVISYGAPKGLIGIKPAAISHSPNDRVLQGIPCSAGIVQAIVRPVKYSDELKSIDGGILATYATDPGFVVLFASASGILTERGSLLSHAAIVSREMGIPCIVGIEGLMEKLKEGMIVEMDGNKGTVTILNEEESNG
jgi:pyruvate,water dikinase